MGWALDSQPSVDNVMISPMKFLQPLMALMLLFWGGGLFASDIKPNQTLQISIQGVPPSEQARLNSTYQVSAGGTITMWEIGTIRASGRTASQLAATIAAAYRSRGIYNNPSFQVVVPNDQNIVLKTVTVGGFVNGPGPKPYRDGMTLWEAVSAAGGANAFGASNRVKLYRNGKVYTYNLKTDQHKGVKMYPGDAVEVPEKNIWGN